MICNSVFDLMILNIKPVCMPARMVIVLGAISGLTTLPQAAFKSRAMLQISAACL